LPEGAQLERAVGYVLSQPRLFLNTSSDLRLLRPTLEAAGASRRPTADELRHDQRALDVQPLFDGATLDRI
jgi:hypothetical protein